MPGSDNESDAASDAGLGTQHHPKTYVCSVKMPPKFFMHADGAHRTVRNELEYIDEELALLTKGSSLRGSGASSQ